MTAYTGTTEKLDPMSLSDATADLLAEQRAAMLERCGITIYINDMYAPTGEHYATWSVYQDVEHQYTFRDELDAYMFAYDLAGACIDEGDLGL